MSGKGKEREKEGGKEEDGEEVREGKKEKKEAGERRGRGNATAVHSCRHFGV